MIKKVLLGILILIALILLGFVGFVYSSYDKNYDAEYPIPDLKVVADSQMIERGRYLAQGPAHCIDCHAPVGYFAHEIMPKEDPRSAIHTDNLLATCSNQFGLQTCHPDATLSFAKGKIHPSGEKAKSFDLKLATVEQSEKMFKGEAKPFFFYTG